MGLLRNVRSPAIKDQQYELEPGLRDVCFVEERQRMIYALMVLGNSHFHFRQVALRWEMYENIFIAFGQSGVPAHMSQIIRCCWLTHKAGFNKDYIETRKKEVTTSFNFTFRYE